ncbi:MAG TPA: type IV secretion system protein [Steroidobacteraceae bacterium]|jgi:type IV secretion system protein VirB6|nr:type IV secretion system protein [Steroidobacteraceae bacterium]
MGFFQTFWTWLNAQLASYISDNTARVASAIEPAVIALATVYIMAWGYLHLTGRIDEPFSTGLSRVIRLTVVIGVSLHLWLYNDVIVDTFYRAPSQLANAVIGASDPVDTVDAIWNRGGAVADVLWHKQGFGTIGSSIMGAVVWLMVGLLCVYVMFLISLSSIACAVLLAIGPLFIALCLFDTTRRFFEAWIAQLANYALITVLSVLVSALLLHLVESYAAQTAALSTALNMVDALDMLLMAGLVLLLMRQIMPIAAGLAGGIALSSFNSVSRSLAWARPASRTLGGLAVAGSRLFTKTIYTDVGGGANAGRAASSEGAISTAEAANALSGRDL